MKKIRIGTRASKLAIAQSHEARQRLLKIYPDLDIEIVKITTSGDKNLEQSLAEIGGKGLFTKELEESLEDGRIDFAVHSAKDLPDTLPNGMILPCIMERENPRDALICKNATSLDDLPKNATIGTCSLRRKSQLLKSRPDLIVKDLRGNVNTRLERLDAGDFDAIVLAVAGLKRLNLEHSITEILTRKFMLPAVGQGAIAIETHENNHDVIKMLDSINHKPSFACVTAERAFLKVIEGSCQTPIGGLAELEGDQLTLNVMIASNDGTQSFYDSVTGHVDDAIKIGTKAGNNMLDNASHLL